MSKKKAQHESKNNETPEVVANKNNANDTTTTFDKEESAQIINEIAEQYVGKTLDKEKMPYL